MSDDAPRTYTCPECGRATTQGKLPPDQSVHEPSCSRNPRKQGVSDDVRRHRPIGIKVILEYELTDLWIDKESFAEEADYWTDERILELLKEDISIVFEEGTWRVERHE